MTFAMYALLHPSVPECSLDSLATQVADHFAREDGFKLEYEQLPFSAERSLILRWGSWFVRMKYEHDETVLDQCVQIAESLGPKAPNHLAHIDRRIGVVFGDDEAREHTNEIIYVMDYLREIPGSILFDPQQGEIVQ